MDVIPQKVEALNKTIETLERMIKACKEMQDGVPESIACKRFDLNEEKLQYVIREDWVYKTNDRNFAQSKCSRGYWINWRDFFCYILYGETVKPLEDFDLSFDIALNMLTDKEKDVIIKYFKDGMTISEIAKERGVKSGAERTCYNTACNKLRKNDIADYFRYGQEVVKANNENMFLKQQKEELEIMLQTLRKKNQALKSDISSLKSNITELENEIKSSGVSVVERLYPVECIKGMSHRLYNILKRSGINFLDEVACHDRDWFLNLNGFGKASVDELEEIAEKFNLKFIERK